MSRRIAVFSDGTGQSIGRNDSNVLRLCKLLDLGDEEQVAIYDPGIGTHVSLNKLQAGLQISDRMLLADSNPDSQLLRRLRLPGELAIGSQKNSSRRIASTRAGDLWIASSESRSACTSSGDTTGVPSARAVSAIVRTSTYQSGFFASRFAI